MVEMICSDADFTVPSVSSNHLAFYNDSDFTVVQCAIKSSTVAVYIYAFNKLNLASTTHSLLSAYIKAYPPAMHLHTSLTLHFTCPPARHQIRV
jgi:hypothetical protein